jgi:hypothetical protein
MAKLTGGVEPPTPEQLEQSCKEQEQVLLVALAIYRERNAKYGDAWRRSGWRGTLTDLRRKIERAWAFLWNAEPRVMPPITDVEGDPAAPEGSTEIDDLYDIINYAAFSIRAYQEANRDGYGGWW